MSWFEAAAFCCWLSGIEGKTVHLPGEEEWEYAARGEDRLNYAWGNDFNPELGNTADTGIRNTSAVGLFAQGKAFGLCDMSGNIWEWTAGLWGTDWGKPKFTYDS